MSRRTPTSISKLRTNLKRVQKEWGDIQNDPAAQQLLEDVSNELGLGDVDDIMWRLRHLDHCLDAYLNPPKYDPFSRYVKKISGVCERVTRKPVTITVPKGEESKTSTFVENMKTLDTVLPDYAQRSIRKRSESKRLKRKRPSPATRSAWAQALSRARK